MHEKPASSRLAKQTEIVVQKEMGVLITYALQHGDFENVDRIQTLGYVIHVGLAQVLQSKDAPLKAVIGQFLKSLRPQSL